MIGKHILIIVVFCAFTLAAVEGKRVLLRPIPAEEVYRMLKAAGREDAVPEGRVISHGIAAIKGFTLGFKKGVLGVAVVDGLSSLVASSSSSSSSSSNTTSSSGINKPSFSYNGTSNELCFTSRSATSDIVGTGEERVVTTPTVTTGTSPTTATTGTTSPTTTNTSTKTQTGTGTGTNTATNTMTTTQTTGGAVNCIVIQKS